VATWQSEKRKKKHYTDEFKQESIRLLATRGDLTVEEIASSLGVFPSMLYQWRKQFGSEPEQRSFFQPHKLPKQQS